MNKKHFSKVGKYIGMACLLFACAMVQSCRDEYFYDDREPDFLGSSIYGHLEEKGDFTHFLQVIKNTVFQFPSTMQKRVILYIVSTTVWHRT